MNLGFGDYTWRVRVRDANHPLMSSVSAASTFSIYDSTIPASCPFIYVWNGKEYEYVTDIQGKMLGLPPKHRYAKSVPLFQPSYIVLDKLKPQNGKYNIKIRETITEADFFDEAKLYLLEHPAGYQVISSSAENTYFFNYVNPQKYYTIKDPRLPKGAWDKTGRDILNTLQKVDEIASPVNLVELPLEKADLYHRGSATYEYMNFQHPVRAKDDARPDIPESYFYGKFTKYGEVTQLLEKPDDKFVLIRHGDEMMLTFDAKTNVKDGMVYTPVLKSDVFYKTSNSVGPKTIYPLPFHGMSSYPYPENEKYPDDKEHRDYLETWNTREYKLNPDFWDRVEELLKNILERLKYIFARGKISDLKATVSTYQTATGKNSFEQHYSLNTNYIEMEVISTEPGGVPGTCTNCHAVHGNSGAPKQLKTDGANLCFGCHSTPANSVTGTVYKARFTGAAGYTSRHSVDTTEQALYGTKVECINCHDPHLNDAENKTVDPDNRYTLLSQWVDNGVANYVYNDGTVYIMAKARHDGTPPIISNQTQTVNNAAYNATINWQTNEKATRQVEWGTTVDYVYTTGDAGLVFNSPHSVTLNGLSIGVSYHYRIKTADALGNVSYSADNIVKLSSPPGAPANLRRIPAALPAGNATEDIRLEWDAAIDPDGDALQYYVALTNTSTGYVANSGWLPMGQTYWNTSVTNDDTHSYSWRVKAKDEYGSEGTYSAADTFTHTGPPTPPPPPSCPILYTWDGTRFRFISDIVAGSNIGLELAPGKYVQPAPDEQIAIPGDMLAEKDGRYIIKIKNERDEVEYIDNLLLQAVDHPIGTRIALNDFVRGQEPWKVYTFSENVKPVPKATFVNNPTYSGSKPTPPADITELVSKVDKRHAIGALFDDNIFTFELGDLSKAEQIKLVLTGWTEFANAAERVTRVEKAKKGIKTAPRLLEIQQPDGSWKSEVIKHIPGHTKTIILDLSKKFPKGTKKYTVRLRGMYRPHFDFVGVDTTPKSGIITSDLELLDSTLEFKGVAESTVYPLPDYNFDKVSDQVKVHEGNFTKFGNVMPLIKDIDDKLVVMDTGDELTVTFKALPPPAAGMTRAYVLKPWAYYKELDAAKVEPMPFRAMDLSKYPESLGSYPAELKKYVAEWNTRAHDPTPGLWQQIKNYFGELYQWFINLFRDQEKTAPKPPWPVMLERPGTGTGTGARSAKDGSGAGKPTEHYSLNTNFLSLGISAPGVSKYYFPNSPGSQAWEHDTMPTFEAPGYMADIVQKNNASTADSTWWSSSRATAEGSYNYQLYKFSVSEPPPAINKIFIKWAGYGEPTPGYDTTIYVWNFSTTSWDQMATGNYPAPDSTVTFFRNKENTAFCNKCHDNTPPLGVLMGTTPTANIAAGTTSDFHGDAAGSVFKKGFKSPTYLYGSTRIACDECHDPHGSSNVYHLRETVNGKSAISIKSTDGVGAKALCQACHTGDFMNNWHASCNSCHGNSGSGHEYPHTLTEASMAACFSCHGHNRIFNRPANCLPCHTGNHADIGYGRTF